MRIDAIVRASIRYRFVGTEAAEKIQRLDITLEEYLESFYGRQVQA